MAKFESGSPQEVRSISQKLSFCESESLRVVFDDKNVQRNSRQRSGCSRKVSFGPFSYITDVFYFWERHVSTMMRGQIAHPRFLGGFYTIHQMRSFTRQRCILHSMIKLKQQIDIRGWFEVYVVKKGYCYLTPGALDYLAHHGPSFITDALP